MFIARTSVLHLDISPLEFCHNEVLTLAGLLCSNVDTALSVMRTTEVKLTLPFSSGLHDHALLQVQYSKHSVFLTTLFELPCF